MITATWPQWLWLLLSSSTAWWFSVLSEQVIHKRLNFQDVFFGREKSARQNVSIWMTEIPAEAFLLLKKFCCNCLLQDYSPANTQYEAIEGWQEVLQSGSLASPGSSTKTETLICATWLPGQFVPLFSLCLFTLFPLQSMLYFCMGVAEHSQEEMLLFCNCWMRIMILSLLFLCEYIWDGRRAGLKWDFSIGSFYNSNKNNLSILWK